MRQKEVLFMRHPNLGLFKNSTTKEPGTIPPPLPPQHTPTLFCVYKLVSQLPNKITNPNITVPVHKSARAPTGNPG